MNKYIDRDKLAEFARHSTIGIDANDIMRFPTADVVEAVRCKDCKYREEYKIFGRPTAYYCLRGCVDSNLSLNENDYCCWGERRESK